MTSATRASGSDSGDDMTEPGNVLITQREIYDKVTGLEDGLGRVEALLEKHVALEEQRNEGVEVRLENHGTRLADQGSQIASLEARVTQGESDHRSLRESHDALVKAQGERDSKKAPWWNIVGAIVGIIAGVGGLVGLFITLNNIAQALSIVAP